MNSSRLALVVTLVSVSLSNSDIQFFTVFNYINYKTIKMVTHIYDLVGQSTRSEKACSEKAHSKKAHSENTHGANSSE